MHVIWLWDYVFSKFLFSPFGSTVPYWTRFKWRMRALRKFFLCESPAGSLSLYGIGSDISFQIISFFGWLEDNNWALKNIWGIIFFSCVRYFGNLSSRRVLKPVSVAFNLGFRFKFRLFKCFRRKFRKRKFYIVPHYTPGKIWRTWTNDQMTVYWISRLPNLKFSVTTI